MKVNVRHGEKKWIMKMISIFLIILQVGTSFLGLLFLYTGLQGPTAIQEGAGGALASAMWILMVFFYMLRRDNSSK